MYMLLSSLSLFPGRQWKLNTNNHVPDIYLIQYIFMALTMNQAQF